MVSTNTPVQNDYEWTNHPGKVAKHLMGLLKKEGLKLNSQGFFNVDLNEWPEYEKIEMTAILQDFALEYPLEEVQK